MVRVLGGSGWESGGFLSHCDSQNSCSSGCGNCSVVRVLGGSGLG